MPSPDALSALSGNSLLKGAGGFVSPWNDYATQFAPQSIFSALRLCEILYLRYGIYRKASERIVDYFLTEANFKGGDDTQQRDFKKLMTMDFGVMERLREIGIDKMCYGNYFVSLHFPFTRVLRCAVCKSEKNMMAKNGSLTEFNFSSVDFSFHARCGSCRSIQRHFIKDYPKKDASKIKAVRWDPKRITIESNEITQDKRYWLNIDPVIISRVRSGDPFLLATLPASFIAAIRDGKKYLFESRRIYHSSDSTLAGVSLNGWGIPPILSTFRNFFRLQVLYRYDEVMKMDYIVPLRIVSPAIMKSSSGNSLMEINLENFAKQASASVQKHRINGADWSFFPFPVNYQAIGGEGQQLDQSTRDTIQNEEDRLLNIRGIPPELYRGSMTLVNAPVGLRLFESSNRPLVAEMNRVLQWMISAISNFMDSGDFDASLERVTITDNIEDKAWRIQAAMTGAISKETGLSPIGIDAEIEEDRVIDESRRQQRKQTEAQKEMEMESISLDAPEQSSGDGQQSGGAGMTPGDVDAQADEEARRLLDPRMPENIRRQHLAALRNTNSTLHAVVLKKMDQYRNQAGNIGRQAGFDQLGIGTEKTAAIDGLPKLMAALNKEFPPPKGKNHHIVMPDGASRVTIGVWNGDTLMNVLSSQEDLAKDPSKMITEIKALIQ